ncbi:MAG TPA: hypothetical protein VK419_08530 [Bryobacteraceae bacterium]|nr:hypothetical protein [Bryobacteraceae bacterium]
MKIFSLGLILGLVLVLCTTAVGAEDLAVRRSAPEHSRTSKRVWIRRATLVAGCAASLVLDTWSTRRAIAAGAIESNPLIANSQGHPDWGRAFGLKAGACGVSAVLQETGTFRTWQGRNADWTWTGINAATAAAYTWTTLHNLGLASELSK